MTAHPIPPPGWYDDPAGSDQERYWEGSRWTRNLRQRPAPVVVRQHTHAEPQQAVTLPQAPVTPQPYPGSPGRHYRMIRTTEDGVPLAGFAVRALATLVDTVLMSAIGALVGWPYLLRAWRGFLAAWRWMLDNPGQALQIDHFDYNVPATIVQLLVMGVSFVVQAVLVRVAGGTIGQLLFGLRVVPAEQGRTRRVPWQVSITRSAVWLAIMAASLVVLVPLMVSYLRPLWHPRLQTWHDSLARTQVITTRGPLARAVLGAGPTRN